MGGSGRNGNITKGNKGKKVRRKTNQYAELENGDRYGRVYKLCGGEHLNVELPETNEDNETIITCRIPGRLYKKVWFKAGQFVVVGEKFSGKIYELKGKVLESELNKVKRLFENTTDADDIGVQIGGEEGELEEDHDDMVLGVRKITTTNKSVTKQNKPSTKNNTNNPTDLESMDSADIDNI
jgi:translation initiation factor IF-1